MTKNIMIVGVGGQGSLLASKMLGKLLLAQGYDVKVSEVHGMSQRGGSEVGGPSGLRKTISSHNSLAHRTTWLRSDLLWFGLIHILLKNKQLNKSEAKRS